ncbi:hypothetical protein CEXT_574141 [Caerostris extrusa]|uniref:Uncharacterized protein n=1 Tax=Caerostris extrusa TaxID=172846 RepID=A0AAV4VY04_CAEEX|nr:hypothetical protein CEXT_574141 [Caerostris extrusa]
MAYTPQVDNKWILHTYTPQVKQYANGNHILHKRNESIIFTKTPLYSISGYFQVELYTKIKTAFQYTDFFLDILGDWNHFNPGQLSGDFVESVYIENSTRTGHPTAMIYLPQPKSTKLMKDSFRSISSRSIHLNIRLPTISDGHNERCNYPAIIEVERTVFHHLHLVGNLRLTLVWNLPVVERQIYPE